jgi:glycosyltransferase involved in cell wall biosynthesis
MVSRLGKVMETSSYQFEIIYVNDSSPDQSAAILNQLALENQHITVIHHGRNFGKMACISTGLKQATGRAVIFLDGDLQDPPEEIPNFIKKWEEGNLVVYGVILKREGSVFFNFLARKFYALWSYLTDFYIPQNSGDFSLLDRKAVDIINSLPEKDRFFRGLRSWIGLSQAKVEFVRPPRFSGKSTQNFLSYTSWASLAITSFSFFPLRVVTYIAVSSIFFFLVYSFSIILYVLYGESTPKGFLSIVGLIIISTTVILFCLSVISEYLIRIYIEVKNRPTSVVEKILNNHQ